MKNISTTRNCVIDNIKTISDVKNICKSKSQNNSVPKGYKSKVIGICFTW